MNRALPPSYPIISNVIVIARYDAIHERKCATTCGTTIIGGPGSNSIPIITRHIPNEQTVRELALGIVKANCPCNISRVVGFKNRG